MEPSNPWTRPNDPVNPKEINKIKEYGIPMPLDFTLDTYNLLLDALKGYVVYTVRRYLEEKPTKDFAVIRHDVDRLPKNALKMARLESERGISSTYYFRVGRGLDLGAVKEVSRLGHEVGYHYEVLSKSNGEMTKATKIFQEELAVLRSVCEIKTISRHGRPLSRFDNEDLLRVLSLEPLGLLGDAGPSIVGIPYYTDAGRSWDGRNSVRDQPNEACRGVIVRDSFEVIDMLKNRTHDSVYLNIHPERWVSHRGEWVTSYCLDFSFNVGKKIIRPFIS